jgi:hypothetical protein
MGFNMINIQNTINKMQKILQDCFINDLRAYDEINKKSIPRYYSEQSIKIMLNKYFTFTDQ